MTNDIIGVIQSSPGHALLGLGDHMRLAVRRHADGDAALWLWSGIEGNPSRGQRYALSAEMTAALARALTEPEERR